MLKIEMFKVKFTLDVKVMAGKLLYGLLTLVVCAKAASISGTAGIDPSQAYIGGHISFPQIPDVNTPLLNWIGNHFGFGGFGGFGGLVNLRGLRNFTYLEGNKSSTSGPFGPFSPFLRHVPFLNLFISEDVNSNLFPSNLDDVLEQLLGSNDKRTSNYSLPSFFLPNTNEGPFIPGLSEALDGARKNLKIALNISSDISTGLRDAVTAALDSDRPADGIRIILNTIAGVYSTVAVHCPLLIVGGRVFKEGIRLAAEVARSIVNVAVGQENNRI